MDKIKLKEGKLTDFMIETFQRYASGNAEHGGTKILEFNGRGLIQVRIKRNIMWSGKCVEDAIEYFNEL